MQPNDDARWMTLMVRSQGGDQLAYRQLLTEISDAISGFLIHRFGAMDFIEDCVQESLLAIHHGRHSYRPGASFRAWMFAIVRHKAIDLLRRERARDRHLDRHADESTIEAVGDPAHGSRDDDADATALLQRLKPLHRQALTLTKINGLSHAEAAARVGISEVAMKVRVHRAMRAAANLLSMESP
jgi:RNA polymerase sigma-70 factor, ECF subfamily